MKYLVFAECNFGDLERIRELMKQIIDEREKGSEKFPNWDQMLFQPHAIQAELYKKSKERQVFFIIETEDPMHLINYRMHLAPYMDLNFIPITSVFKSFEAWMGMKDLRIPTTE